MDTLTPRSSHRKPAQAACRILAVVLNYRTPELSVQAAVSAYQDLDPALDHVVIVDNASPDDSVAKIERELFERGFSGIEIICSDSNGGFAAGNNVGIRAREAQAYLLLNSDTIVRSGAMQALFEMLLSDANIGICSPRLEFEDGEPQTSCFRFHSPISEFLKGACTGVFTRLLSQWDVPLGIQERAVDVDWTSFACVLIRREVFSAVGLLDEDFFMYYEDADFCRMTRNAGFRIVHNPAAHVVHLRGKSSPVKEASRLKKRRPRYYYAARNHYFRKAYGPAGAAVANVLWTMGRFVALPREVIGQKSIHTVERELLDNWQGSIVPRGRESP